MVCLGQEIVLPGKGREVNRYRLLWQGVLAPEAVQFHYHPSSRFEAPAQQVQAIEQLCREARAQGQHVENLPLYRLLDWRFEQQQLQFELGQTCYQDYLGMSRLGLAEAPTVLAVAGTTEIEGRIVLERRSSAVAQGAGLMHVKPSGHIHPPQTAWQALLAETWEELAVRPDELSQALCLGLVQSLSANCACLIYTARTELNWSEWSSRRPQDAWEADELVGLDSDPASLDEWLARPAALSTGPGQAAVRFYREWRYGPA